MLQKSVFFTSKEYIGMRFVFVSVLETVSWGREKQIKTMSSIC